MPCHDSTAQHYTAVKELMHSCENPEVKLPLELNSSYGKSSSFRVQLTQGRIFNHFFFLTLELMCDGIMALKDQTVSGSH